MKNLKFFKSCIPKKTESTQALNLEMIGYTRESCNQQDTNYSSLKQEGAIIEFCHSNRYNLTSIIDGAYKNTSQALNLPEGLAKITFKRKIVGDENNN